MFIIILSIHFLLAEYLEVFQYFGQDREGRISTKQLRRAMQMVGLNPTDFQIQTLINEVEYDGQYITLSAIHGLLVIPLCIFIQIA